MSKVINDNKNKVYIVTSVDEGVRSGFVLTWVTQASLNRKNPKIIMVVSKFNAGIMTLEISRSFCLNLLATNQVNEFCIFGLKSGDTYDKFSPFKTISKGCGVELSGCSAYVHGTIDEIFSTPDRKIMYCTIQEERESGLPPMVLDEVMEKLEEPWKAQLMKKYELDALRDENQFL